MAVPPAPVEPPYANKAVVSAVGTIVLVVVRWLISGELNLPDEGVVALAGAVTTALVYAVSNFRECLVLARLGDGHAFGRDRDIAAASPGVSPYPQIQAHPVWGAEKVNAPSSLNGGAFDFRGVWCYDSRSRS